MKNYVFSKNFKIKIDNNINKPIEKNNKFNDNGWCFGVFLIILHIKWA